MTGLRASPIAFDVEEMAVFAEKLARAARAETLDRWKAGCAAENKAQSGFDPVTEADRAAEEAMRKMIGKHFPDHAITGEEWPDQLGSSSLAWSLDPIDGTRSFICGLPMWTTLIALLDNGSPILGLVDAPSLDEVYIGFEGHASLHRDGERKPIRTSGCTRISEASISTTDPFMFDARAAAAFADLAREARTIRFGLDGYAYARLAAGSLDLVVECDLKPHDYNALIPLVSAAGGTVGNWRGGRDLEGGKIIAASTPELFGEAVAYFERLE